MLRNLKCHPFHRCFSLETFKNPPERSFASKILKKKAYKLKQFKFPVKIHQINFIFLILKHLSKKRNAISREQYRHKKEGRYSQRAGMKKARNANTYAVRNRRAQGITLGGAGSQRLSILSSGGGVGYGSSGHDPSQQYGQPDSIRPKSPHLSLSLSLGCVLTSSLLLLHETRPPPPLSFKILAGRRRRRRCAGTPKN